MMKLITQMFFRLAMLVAMLFSATALAAAPPQSEWVHEDASGKLVYKSTPAGDRIMDFSFAGYMGGGVALPADVPVKKQVAPSGRGDDSDVIQRAVDAVSNLPLHDGLRGAILLGPGTFNCEKALTIKSSGVVVRGSGSGSAGGTTIKMT